MVIHLPVPITCFYPQKKCCRREIFIPKFYKEDIKQFYGDPRFPNAICKEYMSTRPDRIVVCAYDEDEIVGMAGCSEDA